MVYDLKFAPSFQSFVDSSFFHELSRLKLDVFKLDSDEKALYTQLDLNHFTSNILAISLRDDSFQKPDNDDPKVLLRGFLLNFNTIELFKNCNKVQFIKEKGQKLLEQGLEYGLNEAINFYIISFADLKKYKYYYWICMPSFQSDGATYQVKSSKAIASDSEVVVSFMKQNSIVACVKGGDLLEATPNNLKHCDKVAFKDFSHLKDIPSAVTKNILTIWSKLSPKETYSICFIRTDDSSFEAEIQINNGNNTSLKVNGWEKNGLGKLAPKSIDLSSLMDPIKIADQAVDLNLKLMKWRIAPEIELDGIRNTKVLLLGSGTLGCYVSRALLAWGARHITFVDNSTVSFSNPVRQSLYNFEDCGKPKAQTASEALKRIFPSVESSGYQLEIPMIGHPVTDEKRQRKDYDVLDELIGSHDVIFLLMDARETRWLPSVLGRLHNKIVINAALGFDSYLVMRHGNDEDKLGCYFCNDILAPSDSLTDRTLDQMCTVTRPGIALLAASQAVELLVTYLQPSSNVLGASPHQIRGFLTEFKTITQSTPEYEYCCASNKNVVSALQENGWNFVRQALDDYKCVEKLSGLSKVQEEAELALEEDFEFSEEEEFATE